MRRTLRLGILLASLVLMTALGAAAARAKPLVVTVSGTPVGTSLPPNFLGLAVENWTLTQDQFKGSNIGAFMRLLGPHGLLRIGGDSLDESLWTVDHAPAPAWATEGTFGPPALRALARALDGTGWRVILKEFDPARAAGEARDAERVLGAKLAAIEPGNEPDHYGISEPAFLHEFRAYVAAVHAAVPNIPIVGPDVASGGFAWLGQFARQEHRSHQLALETLHEYPESACGGNDPSIADLLSLRDMRAERAAAAAAVRAGRMDGVPAIIDETNSAVCWGAPGTSDTYASALWALDYSLLLAEQGLHEVNFQSRIAGCAPYSPYCTIGDSARLRARPELYGLLAVRQVIPGRFLHVGDPAVASLRAYAVQARGRTLSIVLDNLGPARTVRLRLPDSGDTSAAQTTLMTSSPRGLASTSTAAITLGRRRINAQARFLASSYTSVALRHGALTLHLRAASATILHVRDPPAGP